MRTNEGMIRECFPQLSKYQLLAGFVRLSDQVDLRARQSVQRVSLLRAGRKASDPFDAVDCHSHCHCQVPHTMLPTLPLCSTDLGLLKASLIMCPAASAAVLATNRACSESKVAPLAVAMGASAGLR